MRQGAIATRGSLLTCTVVVGITGLLIACGWAIAHEHAKILFISLMPIGLCALAFRQRGVCIGILLLAAMNGLPFINTDKIATAKLTFEDVAIIALILLAALWILLDNRAYRPSRVGETISRVALLLLLWWLWTVARTAVGQHVPASHAASFGRDFLYFGLLLIGLPRVRLTNRDIAMLLGVLAVGVSLFAAGQIATVIGFAPPAGVIHFEKITQEIGLPRLYTPMTDLVDAGLATAIAASLLARQRTIRLIASPIALLLTVSVVVQLTRARWVGLIIGLLVVSLWLTVRGAASVSTMLRRRLALIVGLPIVAGIAVVLIVPGIMPSGTVIQRLLSIVSNLENNSGTVAVRETVTHTMTSYLGERWPLGLGFIPSSAHYFSGLPGGSIRDPDLGALNAIMTMGAVGALLIYLPILLTMRHCLGRTSEWIGSYAWLRYGGAIWIIAMFVSSITLITFFSATGLTLTAVFLTILVHPSVSPELMTSMVTANVNRLRPPTALPRPIAIGSRAFPGQRRPARPV